jgi:hypothetical protein
MLRAIEARVAKIYGEADGDDIRFGVWALLAYEPAKFREAVKLAKAGTIEAVPSAEPLPAAIHSEIALKAAAGNIYGVMPPGMLTWETDFAKWLEAAEPVIWWHRNETGKPWSLAVMREDGHPFYPDFVVRVRGRKTPGLRLLDPHERFEDSVGKKKSRVRHVAYGKTMLLYKLPADKQFHLIELRNDQQPYVGAPLEASMLLVED